MPLKEGNKEGSARSKQFQRVARKKARRGILAACPANRKGGGVSVFGTIPVLSAFNDGRTFKLALFAYMSDHLTYYSCRSPGRPAAGASVEGNPRQRSGEILGGTSMTTRKYPLAHVKILYGLTAARCAFPECRREVILDATSDEDRKQIGKIAHIVGHSDEGPRGDPTYPREKLDTYENWILLCPTCHDTVDALDSKYTVAELRRLRNEHEEWVHTSLAAEMLDVGFPELEVLAKAIASTAGLPSEDFTITPPRDKMVRNALTDQSNLLLTMGLSKTKEVHSFVQHVALADAEFPERLKAGFVSEYQRLRTENVTGDALFESMRDFSSAGSRDFKRQAAGLAVLSYLFECCEVFEK
jgi:hypothetical protein